MTSNRDSRSNKSVCDRIFSSMAHHNSQPIKGRARVVLEGIGAKSPFLTMSAVSRASLSVLTRELQRERHFALFEVVPYPTKARSQSVSGQELSPTQI